MDAPVIRDEDVRVYFDAFDTDRTGSITLENLRTVLLQLGQEPSKAELSNLIALADVDKNGVISFGEFLSFVKKLARHSEMYKAFREYDMDGNGLVDSAELFTVLQSRGIPVTMNDVADIIKRVDKNGDGQISYPEFVNLWDAGHL
eukprot:PhM_4_TR18820/c1_g1_i1/m.95853/K02183/CALM; calmodulin